MIKNTVVINEIRFGNVTSLQEEIVRLQQQIVELQSQERNQSIESGRSLSQKLRACHQMCREMYYTNASLWGEVNSLKQSYTHLQVEMKIVLDLLERVRKGEGLEMNEYISMINHIIKELLYQNDFSSIVLLLFL